MAGVLIDSGFTEKAVLLCVLGSWRQDTTQLAREPVWRWDDLYCINSCSGRLVLLSLLVLWPASGPGTVELASADPHLVRYLSFFWSRRFRFSSFLFLFLNLFSIFSCLSFPLHRSYPSFVSVVVLRSASYRGSIFVRPCCFAMRPPQSFRREESSPADEFLKLIQNPFQSAVCSFYLDSLPRPSR